VIVVEKSTADIFNETFCQELEPESDGNIDKEWSQNEREPLQWPVANVIKLFTVVITFVSV
jgi:hypothetical protein